MNADTKWHAVSCADVASLLEVDVSCGLTSSDAVERLARFGSNTTEQARTRSAWWYVGRQFVDFSVAVLLAAAVVSGAVGDAIDVIAIVSIVVLSAALGFIQEYRADRALLALRQLATPLARVRRDGVTKDLRATDLVPGDVLLLEAGNMVPADVRVVSAASLKLDESSLTGESVAVEKTSTTLEPHVALADRINVAFKASMVVSGRGEGIVVETGGRTALGKIASLVAPGSVAEPPLKRRMSAFAKRLAVVVLFLCSGLFVLGVARGEPLVAVLLTSISLAVAAIPEALPVVVTVALALGSRKMASCRALVRRLQAVETLGAVTVICTDKTGTLTENRMTVARVFANGKSASSISEPAAATLRQAMALSNDVTRSGTELHGDPTEVALVRSASSASLDPFTLAARLPRVAELPFSSERGRMTTVHDVEGSWVVYTKGAPERVLERCASERCQEGERPLDVQGVLEAAEEMAASGYRVLAFATKDVEPGSDEETFETDLSFLGFVGLMDPPREDARRAIRSCRDAGIRVVMITGDHPSTARAIATSLEIDDGEPILAGGVEMAAWSKDELATHVESTSIFARVAPEQKLAIVEALQDSGECVAMTGDGVNDAPALVRADVGVAMGRSGTDVARESADIVLLDDAFATIVTAVREGRRVYDNVRKFVRYALTGNSGELWTLCLAPLLGLPLPLLPVQILWVNLVTDGLPGLALATEDEEPDVMKRRPRPLAEGLLARGLWQHALGIGLLLGLLTLGLEAWASGRGSPGFRTIAFTMLTFGQMAHVMAIRSETVSILRLRWTSNRLLLCAVLGTIVLQFVIVYVPAMNRLFKTVPLRGSELGMCLVGSLAIVVVVELEKQLIRWGWLYRGEPVSSALA